ncbi:type III pantothenate kinase [Massilia sp. PAMC28688]|uniref:type III pantothenate kinase n=1 Tax=Massilia sp. PAMC28688 TaxID=2861283 RepID=UPI001C635245|nr:type III pantothenate kinase [Massilia sp. PAMC28688]QYF94548.1 type III pantothenate kinase [Massilia sp. PAMC28688]
MMLLVDAGNTRVKWALVQPGAAPGQWIASGGVEHADLDQLPERWRDHAVSAVLVSNVAGAALRARLLPLLPGARTAWFAARAEMAGMRNGYRNPGQLGCDRFAAALGARTLEPGKAIIVATCGTATTIDAVSAQGDFLGGMILPGLGLMASSLARNTAQLPQVLAGGPLPSGFADNTDDAILSGILSAQAGAIERAFARHRADLCLISGGAACYIAPVLEVAHRMVDNVVLIGLQTAAASDFASDLTG